MKYLILGAGPAGLTLANKLKQMGITDFCVLEKEKTAGGLCRSADVDGLLILVAVIFWMLDVLR